MAVKATAAVTVSAYRDTKSITRYYKLVSASASAPTIAQDVNPSEMSGLGWTDTEPTYTSGSTDILYFFDASIFTDGTWLYSDVSKLGSYEAAKDAYDKAVEAAKVATNFLSYDSTNGLQIGNKKSGAWSGYRSQILPTAFNILDANGNVISSYGATTTIGKTSEQHVYIDSDSLYIKNGDTVLATFSGDSLSCGSNFSVDKNGKLTSTSGTIGGFTISSNSLSASDSYFNRAVYVGTDEIRTEDSYGSVVHGRNCSKYMHTDHDEFLIISAGGIGIYHYSTDEGTGLVQRLAFYDNDSIRYSLNDIGIYGSTGSVMVGLDNSTVDAYVDLRFPLQNQVGTTAYPSGRHVLANNTSVGFLNSSGVRKRGFALNSSDHILIGENTGTGGLYARVSGDQNIQFYASSDDNQCFASIVSNGLRYFQSKPIYDRTTSSGTAVRVNSNGTLFRYSSSSMRYKEEITCQLSEELNPERLYDLNVWQYKYREGHLDKGDQRYGKTHIGLLAEDVKQHYPIAANYNEDGYVEDWSERYLIPPMLKLIQMQHEEIELIKAELEKIRNAA